MTCHRACGSAAAVSASGSASLAVIGPTRLRVAGPAGSPARARQEMTSSSRPGSGSVRLPARRRVSGGGRVAGWWLAEERGVLGHGGGQRGPGGRRVGGERTIVFVPVRVARAAGVAVVGLAGIIGRRWVGRHRAVRAMAVGVAVLAAGGPGSRRRSHSGQVARARVGGARVGVARPGPESRGQGRSRSADGVARVGVGGAVGAGIACWRGDQGQGAQQQADERDGPQVVQSAGLASGFHGPGDGRQPGHGRGGMHGWQARAGQGGGAVGGVGVQAHLGVPLGVFTALLGALGVGGDNRPAQRRAQLPAGLLPGARQHAGLDGAGGVIVERAGGLGDQAGPVQVDVPGVQGGPGGGQLPPQGDAEAGPGHRGGVGQD